MFLDVLKLLIPIAVFWFIDVVMVVVVVVVVVMGGSTYL